MLPPPRLSFFLSYPSLALLFSIMTGILPSCFPFTVLSICFSSVLSLYVLSLSLPPSTSPLSSHLQEQKALSEAEDCAGQAGSALCVCLSSQFY